MKKIMECGNYTLYSKTNEPFEYNKLMKTWIFYHEVCMGEFIFKLSEDGECYVDLLLLFPSYRYKGHGTRFIWSLMFELMTSWFVGDEHRVSLKGVASPLEGEEFWKRLYATFSKPIYAAKPIETEDGYEREIVGIPFVISEKTFESLKIDFIRLFRKEKVIYRGVIDREER